MALRGFIVAWLSILVAFAFMAATAADMIRHGHQVPAFLIVVAIVVGIVEALQHYRLSGKGNG